MDDKEIREAIAYFKLGGRMTIFLWLGLGICGLIILISWILNMDRGE